LFCDVVLTFDINPEIKELIGQMLEERGVVSAASLERLQKFAAGLQRNNHPVAALSESLGHLFEVRDHSLALCGNALPLSIALALVSECVPAIQYHLDETALGMTAGPGMDFARRCSELATLDVQMSRILDAAREGLFGSCEWHSEKSNVIRGLASRFDAFFLDTVIRLDFLVSHYCHSTSALPVFIESIATGLDLALERNPSTYDRICNRIDSWLSASSASASGTGIGLAGALHLLQSRVPRMKARSLAGFRTGIAQDNSAVAQQIGHCLAELLFEHFYSTERPGRMLEEVRFARYGDNYRGTLDRCLQARNCSSIFCERLIAALEPGSPRVDSRSEVENLICDIALLSHGRGLEGFLSLAETDTGSRSRGTSEEERKRVRHALYNAKCALLGFVHGCNLHIEKLTANPAMPVDLADLLERTPTPEYLLAGMRSTIMRLTDRLSDDLIAGVRWCHADDLPAFLNKIFSLLAAPGLLPDQKARLLGALTTVIFSRENSIYSVARAAALRKFLLFLRCRPELTNEGGVHPLIDRVEREGWLSDEWADPTIYDQLRKSIGDQFEQSVRRPLRELVTGIAGIFQESDSQGLAHTLEWQFRELGFQSELELLEISWPSR
jgi:hypothetical protein